MRKSMARILASCLVVAGLMSAVPVAHAGLESGLLNYWNFDDNLDDAAHGLAGSASTVADNGTFDGTNGTDGIAYAAGLFGSAIQQNGAGGGAAGQEDDGFV
ncbi:MAG: hypothetical protein KDA99_11850, partial [Planctomycetales bacterium]|nr:hypothetical protein [Planctomycetales bacterium]